MSGGHSNDGGAQARDRPPDASVIRDAPHGDRVRLAAHCFYCAFQSALQQTKRPIQRQMKAFALPQCFHLPLSLRVKRRNTRSQTKKTAREAATTPKEIA
ncbi:MAG: hypothetical protein KF834_13325 [Burkholderiales bacterium]|nr:hypothetical protein [Burkholderiales bacterium]